MSITWCQSQGKAHIAYMPNKRVVGISKLARVMDSFAKRLQTQETMTAQIANCIQEALEPQGVAILDRCQASMHDNKRCKKAVCVYGDNTIYGRIPR